MTAYEMRISDWSSDVCSSDLVVYPRGVRLVFLHPVRYSETANDAAKLAGAILIRLLGTGRVADGALARLHAASPNRSAGRVPSGVRATTCQDSEQFANTSALPSPHAIRSERKREVKGKQGSIRVYFGCRRRNKTKTH